MGYNSHPGRQVIARFATTGGMIEAIRKGEFARVAGVNNSAITHALRGALAQALTPDRKRIYPDHPAAVAYVKGSQLAQKRRTNPPRGRSTPRNGGKPAMDPGEDPFAFAQRMANMSPAKHKAAELKAIRAHVKENARENKAAVAQAARAESRQVDAAKKAREKDDAELPLWVGTVAGSRAAWAKQYLFDVERGISGQFPDDITDLGAMSLREMVDRFGSIELLGGLVKLLASYATMTHKEAAAAERRGELIPRTVISTTLIPLIDLAFRRLVTEAPGALAEQVIARVLSASASAGGGGGDLRLDIEALIRRENSTILTDCRNRFLQGTEG